MTWKTAYQVSCVGYVLSIATLGFLLSQEHRRAEYYRLAFLDAESIISMQSKSVDNAQMSLNSAAGIIETCTEVIRKKPENFQ